MLLTRDGRGGLELSQAPVERARAGGDAGSTYQGGLSANLRCWTGCCRVARKGLVPLLLTTGARADHPGTFDWRRSGRGLPPPPSDLVGTYGIVVTGAVREEHQPHQRPRQHHHHADAEGGRDIEVDRNRLVAGR